jgi:uncharacterized repeat protein (TIGR01451 family)
MNMQFNPPPFLQHAVTGRFLIPRKVADMRDNSTDFPNTTARQLLSCIRQAAAWLLLGCMTLSPALLQASEATLCANAKRDTNPDTCEDYVNGNLGQSKALYLEGDSIAGRVVLDQAVAGHVYEITIGWDAVVSGKNALDYLATHNYSVTLADPCEGGALCEPGSPNHSMDIPPDTRMQRGRDNTPGTEDDVPQVPGEFLVWGGEILSVGDYTYPPDFDYSGSQEVSLTLRIEAQGSPVVLAWGGHIASRLDWGNENGVVNLSGSPYHMRVSGNEYINAGAIEPIGSISGIQGDLSLASGAVVFPAYLNVTKEADRSTGDDFLFLTDGMADGVVNGSFSLKDEQTLQLRVEGNTSAWVEEDLSQLLDYYGEPLWELDAVVCTDNNNVPVEFLRDGDRIDIALGEALEVDCYFQNIFTGLPKLELAKKVIPAGLSCDTVDFNAAGNESLDIASGDTVRYCYRVQNAGNDIAYDLALDDDAGSVTELLDDFAVTLAGGDLAELGKDGAVADLGVAGNAYGEATVLIALPVGGSVTNTATARGIDAIDVPISDEDTATVNVTSAQDCNLTAGVSTTGSCDDAAAVANVIEGTPLTWCANTCLQTGNSDLSDATIALMHGETEMQSAVGQTLPAGSCNTWTFDETAGSSSHARMLMASGVDDYTNPISCMDNATANVYDPDISISKYVSLDSDNRCGNGDDVEQVTVYYGTPVWYCFVVQNLGDEDLVNVRLRDEVLGLEIELPDLAAGSEAWESGYYEYGPVEDDIHNTARVSASGGMTEALVSHDDSADVQMLFADIRVEKTGTTRLDAKQNETAVSYSITVSNIGNVAAEGVVLTDTLPDLVDYLSDDAGCAYDADSHVLTCDLGEIAMDDAVIITITGELVEAAPVFGSFENLACAEVTGVATPDVDPDNNCDTHNTRIVPGATRTIGYWQNHPETLGQCLELEENTVTLDRASDGSCGTGTPATVNGIDLGYVQIANEACDDEIDATVSSHLNVNGKGRAKPLVDPEPVADGDSDVETALEAALGVLKASPAHWTDGTKRSDLDQARTTAGRQVLAAICNVTLLEALRPGFLDDHVAVLSGGDIEAILGLSANADGFNNSGDDEPIGDHVNAEPGADPGANSDDPTDPSD